MDKSQSPQFQSLQGFNKLVWGERHKLLAHFEDLFEISERKCFKPDKEDEWYDERYDKERYKVIRLLDTFLSDSFILDEIEKIIAFSKTDGYRIEILLLDPFSIFAESRAKALSLNAVEEINRTLFCLKKAVFKIKQRHREIQEREFKTQKKDIEYMFKQVSSIREYEEEFSINIKFYELLTDTPIYLISLFVMKGFILFNRSSMENPWMIFVDDPTQPNDLYDHLYFNFDQIWEVAKEWPVRKRQKAEDFDPKNVFLSHGRNELIKLKIKDYVEKDLGRNPVLFERHAKYGKGIFDNLEALTDKCSSAIIILTKEDELKSDESVARQNVIHELGYCQAKYGWENVLVLVEKGIKIPSNIGGRLYINFDKENLESCFYKIARMLNSLQARIKSYAE
ncbi:MAG: TIR domain-containing protein [Candidatus Thorarchaeota archaeon]